MARLVPLEARTTPRPLGRYKDQIVVGRDFDAPLPDAFPAWIRARNGR